MLELKKKFGEGNKKSVKVVEIKRLEQGERTIKEFMQEFKKVARKNRYEERALVEEFNREINRVIRRKLMEAEKTPISIE